MGPLGVIAFLLGRFLVELTKNVRNATELEKSSYICGEKITFRFFYWGEEQPTHGSGERK